MRRGTTPKLIFEIRDKTVDLSVFTNIIVTIKAGSHMCNWDMERITIDNDKKTIEVELSQEETLSFPSGKVELQLRFLANSGMAYATKIIHTNMESILFEGVIE